MDLLLTRPVRQVYAFFFNDPATTQIYTLSLHDALPISQRRGPDHRHHPGRRPAVPAHPGGTGVRTHRRPDRKSTRLNSSHRTISYAVFCLKKKNKSSRISASIM